MNAERVGARAWIAVALLVMSLVASQYVAAASVPPVDRVDAGRFVGRSTFAFLSGLRTFGAAVLWNRLDPVFHGYYDGVPISQQKFALPTVRMVTMLDPQFTQAYYVASYTVARQGDVEEGVSIAREGLANNPRSGLLVANLAQVLMLQDREGNLREMVELTTQGLSDQTQWASADDFFEGLVVFRTVLRLAGDDVSAERVEQAITQLEASGEVSEDHDHDGDGVQDH